MVNDLTCAHVYALVLSIPLVKLRSAHMNRTKEQRNGYLSLQLRAHAPKQLLISSLEAGAQQGVG